MTKWTIERNARQGSDYPHALWWGAWQAWWLTDEQAAPEAWSEIGRDPSLPDTVDVLRDGTLIFTAPYDGATLDGHTLHFCGQGSRVDHRTRKGWRYIARPIPEPATKKVPWWEAMADGRKLVAWNGEQRIKAATVHNGQVSVTTFGLYDAVHPDADGHVEVLA